MASRKTCLPMLLLAASLSTAAPPARAQPAQEPLVNRTGTGVKPNVMLTLDDSNSMAFQHMPEGRVVLGSHEVQAPVGGSSLTFHPDDRGPQAYAEGFYLGTVASQRGTTNWRQKFLRSPDTNFIYYNPQVRYLPWIRPDGSRYPAAVITAAQLDPEGRSGTVDLTRRITGRTALWCLVADESCARATLDHEPGLYYRLRRDAQGAPLAPTDAANYDRFDINVAPSAAKAPARTDCAGAICTLAEERQNFATWFVYYRSRLLFAKAAVGEVLQEADDTVRLGYARIGKPAGQVDGIAGIAAVVSGVRDFTPARKQEVMGWLYGLDTDTWTFLRRAMQGVGKYFSSAAATGPWSETPGIASTAEHKACRRSYQVVVTDGYWNDDVGKDGLAAVGNVDGKAGPKISGPNGQEWTYKPSRPYQDEQEDMLADYAMYFWSRDLRPDLANRVQSTAEDPAFWQHLSNFTVGLGVRGVLDPKVDLPALAEGRRNWPANRIDDLWHAALNSRGQYFSAQNPVELKQALSRALRSTLERELHDAGVATASTVLEAGNRKYVPRYRTGSWIGDIEAYALDENGQAGQRLWSASERMPDWASRNIVTWDDSLAPSQAVPFRWGNLGAGLRARLPSATGAALVDFIRGDRSNEGAGLDFRVRQRVLGDFINSTPVFAKSGQEASNFALPVIGSTYQAYLNTVKATRTGVLYIGGNDGMLHAFRDSQSAGDAKDGREIFAYVPRSAIDALPVLADKSYGQSGKYHQYFVDGPMREADVHVPAPGGGKAEWRNYLLGSAGAGGRSVFALDITDPEQLGAKSVRWEIRAQAAPDLGYIRFPVQAGQLPNGKWVALFGNGSGSASGAAVLYVVEVDTGSFKRVIVPSALGNGLGGVGLVRDISGQVVAAYAGDLAGNLYRFEYSADAASTGFFRLANGGKAVFSAPAAQPIVQPPLVFPHALGGNLVVVGTGQLLSAADATDRRVQAVYAVRDTPGTSAAVRSKADLAERKLAFVPTTDDQSSLRYVSISGDDVNWKTQQGWFATLELEGYDGLRVAYPMQVLKASVAFIGAIAPGQNVAGCESSDGKAVNLLLPAETGSTPARPFFDTNADGVFDNRDAGYVGYATSADGADAVLEFTASSKASCTLFSLQNTTGQVSACVGSGSSSAGTLAVRDRVWRRLLNPPF